MGFFQDFSNRQNRHLEVETIPIPLPPYAPGLSGVKVAILADLHMQRPTAYHGAILDEIKRMAPQAILIAGDTMDSRTKDVNALAPFFGRLSAIAPTIAILGNNDCIREKTPRLRSMYQGAGVILLENETRMLALPSGILRITGLTDPAAMRRKVHRERPMEKPEHLPMAEALSPQKKEKTALVSLLMIHQPQQALHYVQHSPHVMVAGHAHGGQVRLPLIGGLFSPGQGLFPRYTSGLYAIKDTRLVVSRGLGNHDVPLRLNNRPHLPVIHFV